MEKTKYCTECCSDTLHFKGKLFPDEDNSPLIWCCSVCLEENEIIGDFDN